MAQQASPNVAGQTELLRMYPARLATDVSRKPAGSFSSIPMKTSVPVQSAAPPDVGVRDEHGEDEQDHLDEGEDPQLVEADPEREEEHRLDVEDDEQHGGQVVLHREATTAARVRRRLDAALVRVELGAVVPLGARR